MEDVIINERLNERPSRPPNFELEAKALRQLAIAISRADSEILQELTDLLLETCAADSAGISLAENDAGDSIFRWHATSGELKKFKNGTMPGDFSPCGVVLERNSSLLMQKPIRYWGYIESLGIPLHEVLLSPFYRNGRAIGTIWVVSHREEKEFDLEDQRILNSLSEIATAAVENYFKVKQLSLRTQRQNQEIETERSRREKLEGEKQKIESIVRQSVFPIAVFEGPEHTLVIANESYRETFGFTEDPVGKNVMQLLPEAGDQGFVKLLDRVYKTGEPFIGKELFFKQRSQNGKEKEFYLDFTYAAKHDEHGKIDGVIATIVDVTERVLIRQKLETSESRARRYAEAMPQMAFIADADGRMTYFNQNFFNYTGIPNEDFLGRKWESKLIHHPDDFERTMQRWNHSVQTGEPYEIEYRLLRFDGEYRWHLGRATADKDRHGNIREWFGTNTDIHDQKMAIERATASERLMSLTANSIPALIAYVDRNLQFQFVNSSYQKWFGLSSADFLGKHLSEVLGDELFREVQGALAKALNGEAVRFQETAPYPGDASKMRLLQISYTPDFDKITEVVRGISIFIQDITEQEKSDSDLQDARVAAETASRAKSAFLANMSHEIRTPLGAIMGFADLARQPGVSAEDTANYLSVIERNSSQVLRIIDDILDLAKVEAGRVVVEMMEFSLIDFIADLTSTIGFRAQDNGISFHVDAETDLPTRISTDPTRLRQILINAVGNAIKFTQKGSVFLKVGFQNGELRFLIEDTGRGISKEQAENLFQAFVQADATTTRKYGGTGLGLALTKRLCHALGGDYVLSESELGKGSKFIATVKPKVSKDVKMVSQDQVNLKESTMRPQAVSTKRLDAVKVLLVEDSPDNQILIKLILEKQGVRLAVANDGAEGVEQALSGDFDIVLMDIQMPKMDGHEATQKLRSLGFEKPIVALTAHAMKEEGERAAQSGFTAFLSKPIQRGALIDAIARLT